VKFLKGLITRKRIYSLMVALGGFMILHASYMYAKDHCAKKENVRQVVSFYALVYCKNSKCIDEFYEKLDQDRKKDMCRFIKYGQ
jgi:hypothetical protein